MQLGHKFKRWIQRQYSKMVKENASPEFIARGWAIGMFCGCLLPFGCQLIISIPAAIILKGSKIGASVGTLLTNHVTIFFIYPAQCYVGSLLIGKTLKYAEITRALDTAMQEESLRKLFELGSVLITSFFVGGALLTAIMTPITYIGVKSLVTRYQALSAKRKAARQKKMQNQNNSVVGK